MAPADTSHLASNAAQRRQLKVLRALAETIWPSQPDAVFTNAAQERFFTKSGGDDPRVAEGVSGSDWGHPQGSAGG